MLNIPQNKLDNAVEALQIAGLFISHDQIINATHDRLYRIGTTDKPKGKDGWFKVLYDSSTDFVTIVFGNWQTQTKDKLHINLKQSIEKKRLTPEERQALQAKIDKKILDDRAKRNKELNQKRTYYVNEYNQLQHCYSHGYLTRKGILYPQQYQLRTDTRANNNLLCVPFINGNGELQGYQSITIDGSKRFNGSVGGFYWQYPMTNPCPEVFNHSNSFFILCEGLATGLSAYEAITEFFDIQVFLPIILCAFNVGNLDKVITATKAHKLPYLLLVDNDSTKPRNAGIETAKALLMAHAECEIYPLTFSNGNDANDFIIEHGYDEFIKLIDKYAYPIINKIHH